MSVAQKIGWGISWVRAGVGMLWRLEAQLKGVQFEGKVRLEGRPIISLAHNSRMVIRSGVSINSATRSNPLGCFQPSVLRTLAPNAELIIGRNSGMSGAVICAGAAIRIGEGTIIGSGAMILDNDFHRYEEGEGWMNEYQRSARPVIIGGRVFIGARAIILKGVTIGEGAVVGAGAVVTQDVPPGALAAGNPAKVFERRPPTGES